MAEASAAVDKLPEWIPDEKAPDCMLCGKTFSWKRGKHHCRLCGHVVCGKCSENKIKLPKLATSNPVRVCDTCFQKFAPSYMQRKGGGSRGAAGAAGKGASGGAGGSGSDAAAAASGGGGGSGSGNGSAAAATANGENKHTNFSSAPEPELVQHNLPSSKPSTSAGGVSNYGATNQKTEASNLLSPTGSKTARAVMPGYDSDDDEGQCASCKQSSCTIM